MACWNQQAMACLNQHRLPIYKRDGLRPSPTWWRRPSAAPTMWEISLIGNMCWFQHAMACWFQHAMACWFQHHFNKSLRFYNRVRSIPKTNFMWIAGCTPPPPTQNQCWQPPSGMQNDNPKLMGLLCAGLLKQSDLLKLCWNQQAMACWNPQAVACL